MTEKKPATVSASPKVRKFARELGANLHLIEGSQREDRVTENDVRLFVKESLSGKVLQKKETPIQEYDHSSGRQGRSGWRRPALTASLAG